MHRLLPAALLLVLAAGTPYTADQVFRGNAPTASGQIAYATAAHSATWGTPATAGLAPSSSTAASGQPLCGTGSGTAAFEAPATCGLAVASNAPTAAGYPLCATSSTAASYELPATCGLAVVGASQSFSGVQTFSSGIKLNSSGTTITASYRGTTTTAASPTTVAAASCTLGYASVTVTGCAAGADCIVGPGGANNLVPWCRVSATNTVLLNFCNPTTSALAPPASTTYAVRCFNP